MPRRSFACFALMSAVLLSAGGCGDGASTTSTGGGGTGGSGGTGATGGTGGTGGSTCQPEDEVCDGADNDCDGTIDEDCPCVDSPRSCYSGPMGTEGVGTCVAGTQTCDPATGVWSDCVGEIVPADEACNTLDDDCNGAADDMGTITCGVGACQTTVTKCDAGTPGACVPGAPSPEICDGIDNNCNQLVDETYPDKGAACDSGEPGACQAGTNQCLLENGVKAPKCVPIAAPSTEACDGIDNDCNGMVDDDVPGTGVACTSALPGPCEPGTLTCVGNAIECLPDVMPTAETCDGVDNDCNGATDDPPGSGEACDTGLLGVCQAGLMLCDANGMFGCVQQEQAQATDPCGDNQDNDCDGTVDPGCLYTFSGVQNDVPIADLFGWTECYLDSYGDYGTPLSTILAQCSKSKLLLGCRQNGASTLALAAHAPRVDVTFDTGSGNTPHDANGTGWYYSDDWSWGFAGQGDVLERNSCDVASTNPEKRLCWHTGGGNINDGWRCGTATSVYSGYERVVYHAD